jgi:hypothetical protein
MEAPGVMPKTSAMRLAEDLRDHIARLEAHDVFIDVPVVLPFGHGRLAVMIESNGGYRLICSEAIVWSAIQTLGRSHAFDVCSGFEIQRDGENELVYTEIDRWSEVGDRFKLFVAGLQALIWSADAKGTVPAARPRSSLRVDTERFQQLAHCVLQVRNILSHAVHFHNGGSGVGVLPVTEREAQHLDRLAFETVFAAHLPCFEMANARARAALTDSLLQIESDLLVNETHSQRDLIVRTLQSYRRMIERRGVAEIVLGAQREFLREVVQS